MPYVAASARAKIRRAKEHFNTLYGEFERFVNSHPYEIRQEFEPDAPEIGPAPSTVYVVYYPTATLSWHWPLLLGEMFYNLRSALDHVVYDLGPRHRSEFPIFTDRDAFYAVELKEGYALPAVNSGLFKIRGITDERTRDAIEAAQPFNVGQEEGRYSVLWLLQELCNIDKHRTFHLCRRQTRRVEITPPKGVNLWSMGFYVVQAPALEGRTVLASYAPLFGRQMEMNVEITFDIAFDEGELPQLTGESVTAVCRAIIDYVERLVGIVEATVP